MALRQPAARRIGVFGGAFDPPHVAHIALAQAAVTQFKLDELHVIPTGQAWHKERALSDADHRLAMAALAFGGLANVVVDDRELRRAGPTFTIDTLEALQVEHPAAQLYLVIGADQAAVFRRWHRYGDILKIAIICIADRAHSAGPADDLLTQDLLGATIERFQLPLMDLSATRIRQLAAQGAGDAAGLAGLVPETIARYISSHRLYGASAPPL